MSQDTLTRDGVWILAPTHGLGLLQLMLGRQIAVTDDGRMWLEMDEVDRLFAPIIPQAEAVADAPTVEPLALAPEDVEALTAAAEAVLEFSSRPDMALFRLGEDEWRIRLYAALHPDSELFVGVENAREAAEMIMALADPLGDEGYLIDAALAVLALARG